MNTVISGNSLNPVCLALSWAEPRRTDEGTQVLQQGTPAGAGLQGARATGVLHGAEKSLWSVDVKL